MIELIYYRHNNLFPQAEMVRTKIYFNELTIVLKGELNYTVNGEKLSLYSGDVIFVKAGSIRQREKVENSDYVSFNFVSQDDFDFPSVLKNGTSDVILQLINTFDLIYKYTTNLFPFFRCFIHEQQKLRCDHLFCFNDICDETIDETKK